MRLSKQIDKRIELPNDPDGAWIKIKHLPRNIIDDIVADTSEAGFIEGEAQVKWRSRDRLKKLVAACLVDFGNLFDEDGSEMECNKVNVLKSAEFVLLVDGEEIDFLTWVNEQRETLFDEVEKERKSAAKN